MKMEANVATRRKTSLMWDYFTINEDDKFVKCATCELQVLHSGKTAKTFGITNLSVHLKGKHPEMYTEFEKKVKKMKAREKSAESQA